MTSFYTPTKQDSFYDEVEWYDTDASEDEDYLPQFHNQQQLLPSIKSYFLNKQQQLDFTQISGSSFDSASSLEVEEEDDDHFFDLHDNKQIQLQQRKLSVSDTPLDKVRRAIDKMIDYGIERVDISHIELAEIPDEIEELQYVTVVHNDIVKIASLQIFLYGNDLHRINPCLFGLKNLTVLSLRNNRLTTLPTDVALLENLVELSLGNNQLKYIPAELLRLKKLTILSLFPNPFLSSESPHDQLHRQSIHQRRSSLTEISTRTILASQSATALDSSILPADIVSRFQSITKVNCCEHCKLLFHVPDVEDLVWQDVLGNHHVPVLYRFCSVKCCNALLIKDQQGTEPAEEATAADESIMEATPPAAEVEAPPSAVVVEHQD